MHLRGKAEQILPSGETVVRTDDGVVLVPNAIPGDTLEILLTGKRRGAQRGEILRILEASADRVDPPCPVASECGGCSLQYLSADHHGALKSGWVRNAFHDVTDDACNWQEASLASGMRRRLRWSVGHDAAGMFLGFQARASHQPVRHASCMAVTPVLDELHRQLELAMDHFSDLESIQSVQLHNGIHVILEGESIHVPTGQAPFEAVNELPVQWWVRQAGITRPWSRPVRPLHDRLPLGGAGSMLEVEIGPDDFVQAVEAGNQEMIRQIFAWSEGAQRVADLFSGVGNLSLPLAAAGAEVIGAENNAASVRAANRNARCLNLSARYVEADLFQSFDPAPFTGMDVLILDPPRRGARKVCDMVGRMLPRCIIMVSCDPASGARDGKSLQSQGYRMQALRALDLFPYAGHVETMSLWVQ